MQKKGANISLKGYDDIFSTDQSRAEAQQEQIRTMMEQTKQTNEALKDLVSKSLDFMSSMQANMNQTRTKILG